MSRQVVISAIALLLAPAALTNPARGQSQYQSARIQFLTTLPTHRGFEKLAPTRQYPNKGKLVPAEGMRIEPPYAWNRTDKYVAPNFDAFFPDDPAGGKQLDALFTGKLGGQHDPGELLAAVRQARSI